jgi:hypothetical protein
VPGYAGSVPAGLSHTPDRIPSQKIVPSGSRGRRIVGRPAVPQPLAAHADLPIQPRAVTERPIVRAILQGSLPLFKRKASGADLPSSRKFVRLRRKPGRFVGIPSHRKTGQVLVCALLYAREEVEQDVGGTCCEARVTARERRTRGRYSR